MLNHSACYRGIALLLASVLLVACAGMKDRTELLDSAQHTYESALRWGHYDIVYALHRNADGTVPKVPDNLSNYRVTSYSVLSNTLAANESSAEQTIQIKYYHVDYMQEKTLTQRQHWVFNPQRKVWLVTTPPPTFE